MLELIKALRNACFYWQKKNFVATRKLKIKRMVGSNIDMLMDGNEKRGWRMQDYRPYYWVNIQNNFQKNQDDLQVSDAVNWILDYEFS